MKAISLLLAAVGGAGFLYRSQLQTLMNSPRAGTQDVSSNQGDARLAASQQPQQATLQPESDRIVPGHFHTTTLDAPTVRTNRPENIVSTSGAPVIYPVYQTSQTVVIERRVQPGTVRTVVVAPQHTAPPRGTPPPSVNRN